MSGLGITLDDVAAVCLTHLDADHFHTGWVNVIPERGLRVFVEQTFKSRLIGLARRHPLENWVTAFGTAPFEPIRGVCATVTRLRHDEDGSCGFVFSASSCRVGYATDLGRAPPSLIEHFAGVDILALESNYDTAMQLASDRPAFLKSRIMNGSGHLSNEQALDAIRRIFDRGLAKEGRLPCHVVLLHRSRHCNCPDIVRSVFSADPRIESRLVLAHQREPTGWLDVVPRAPLPGEQLMLSWTGPVNAPAI